MEEGRWKSDHHTHGRVGGRQAHLKRTGLADWCLSSGLFLIPLPVSLSPHWRHLFTINVIRYCLCSKRSMAPCFRDPRDMAWGTASSVRRRSPASHRPWDPGQASSPLRVQGSSKAQGRDWLHQRFSKHGLHPWGSLRPLQGVYRIKTVF